MADESAKSKAAIDKIPDADFAEIFAFIEGHTLAEARAWLIGEYGAWLPNGSISTRAISEWATNYREEIKNQKSLARILQLRSAKENSEKIVDELGNLTTLNRANAALISQSLIDAQLAGDAVLVKILAEQFLAIVGTVAKAEGVEVKRGALETIREKFKAELTKKIDLGLQEVYKVLEKTKEGKAIIADIQRVVAAEVEAV